MASFLIWCGHDTRRPLVTEGRQTRQAAWMSLRGFFPPRKRRTTILVDLNGPRQGGGGGGAWDIGPRKDATIKRALPAPPPKHLPTQSTYFPPALSIPFLFCPGSFLHIVFSEKWLLFRVGFEFFGGASCFFSFRRFLRLCEISA